MNKKQTICILLVEDDALDRKAVERTFKKGKLPYKLEFAETLAAAKERLDQGGIDLLLIDQSLPDGAGLELQKQLEDIPSIFLTGAADTNTAVRAMKAGAYDYLVKDTARDYLLLLPVTIEKALERKRDADELERYRLHLEEEVQQRTGELQEANEQLNIEITERVQTEEALQESEEKYRALYDNAPLSYQSLNENGCFLDVNPAWLKMLGYESKEVIGQRFGDFLHPDGKPRFEKKFPKFIKLGYVRDAHYKIRHKKGHYLDILIEGCVGYHPDGSFKQTYCVFQDVTERVQAEQALRESENRFRSVVETATDAIITIDSRGKIVFWNDAAEAIFGYSAGEIVGKIPVSLMPERFRQGYTDAMKQVLSAGKSSLAGKKSERIGLRKDGNEFPVELTTGVWESGGSPFFTTIVRDITERVRAAQALQESEARFKEIAEAIDEVFTISDAKSWSVLYANPAYEKLWGRSVQDLLEDYRSWDEGIHPDDLVRMQESWTRMLENGVSYEEEHRVIRPDGSMRWVRSGHYPIRDESGQVYRIAGIVQDITARVRVQEALREAEAKARNLIETLPGIAYIAGTGEDGVWKYVSPQIEALLGYTPEEWMADPLLWTARLHPDDRQEILKKENESVNLADGHSATWEYRLLARDGSVVWMRDEGVLFQDEPGGPLVWQGVMYDITEHKKLEAQLVFERDKFNFILQELPIGVSVLDADHKFIYINPISMQLDSYPKDPQSILGEHVLKVHPKQKQSKVEQLLRDFVSGEKTVYVREAKRGNRTIEIAYHALRDSKDKYLGLVRLVSDISERVQAEEEKQRIEVHLRQQQKLESLGTLASGVAHEINNPIAGIMNYAQLISERLDPEQNQLREFADGIGQETERVAGIVRNLLAFARQEKQSHSPARITDIVNDTLLLIRTVIRRDQITLEVDLPDGLPKIKCRSQQIQQVLMNLLTNSRDALNERYPEHDPNKIIKVTVRPFEKEGRPWLRTTVEDHGAGIPAAIRERIFDPFYTTKDRSQGTGLGLSISRGIVQEHRGELSFESVENQFTRFYLDLPVDNGWELGTGNSEQ